MIDTIILMSWAEFAVRWLHVITAIAWIGSSFYFIALDLGLRRECPLDSGADGEQWQVHGGGFYHIQKYLVAPTNLPEGLIWFKWESYATWLSGFVLLVLVYYIGAELYLVDPAIWDVPHWQAILVSIASLIFGWIAYHSICKIFVNINQNLLMLALFVLLVGMSLVYSEVFSGRAALLHLGAFTATIMSGNVFFVIIPNQKIVVADLKANRKPDEIYGKVAKQRSTHNNYLTLPVIFLMLSVHYPLAFASEWNWLIAALVFLMGVTIRHFFNSLHSRKTTPWWTWGATGLIFLVIVWLSLLGSINYSSDVITSSERRFTQAKGFEDVYYIVAGRCSMCHGQEPGWEGMAFAPKGVVLETPAQIARHARDIYLHSGVSNAMPPANLSYMEEEERQRVVAWYRSALND
ncbi:MAG: urate hydroxylase PuuD [Aestuariivita sp.]|nr:urate hydroxylase PuuD [Aestuariivita sp.]